MAASKLQQHSLFFTQLKQLNERRKIGDTSTKLPWRLQAR